ncbi:MAG: hypothetical protein JW782_01370 [Candidatus Saganbacteria bacterium]|nr:hypothetical protein [Candidatus Saganbacteria bacterium]
MRKGYIAWLLLICLPLLLFVGCASSNDTTTTTLSPASTTLTTLAGSTTTTTNVSTTTSAGGATDPPAATVKLAFVHHSCGENWLNDSDGGLGVALRDNNYFVSDTNYGWGPSSIGDNTDIGWWYEWFRGASSSTYLSALYAESGQNCTYSRLGSDPGGENEVIMFKSCFPNSTLTGLTGDPVPAIASNPLRGENWDQGHHSVANAKGIYIDLLNYFATRQDKLFIAVTAPPLIDGTYGSNARYFNDWLVNDWLASYTHNNVAVFDFYNVLTGPDNHHRWSGGAVQHYTAAGSANTAYYPTGDPHPNSTGNQKATTEYLPLLNYYYNRWKGNI